MSTSKDDNESTNINGTTHPHQILLGRARADGSSTKGELHQFRVGEITPAQQRRRVPHELQNSGAETRGEGSAGQAFALITNVLLHSESTILFIAAGTDLRSPISDL